MLREMTRINRKQGRKIAELEEALRLKMQGEGGKEKGKVEGKKKRKKRVSGGLGPEDENERVRREERLLRVIRQRGKRWGLDG